MNKILELQQLIALKTPVTRDQLDRIIASGLDLTNVNTSQITDMSNLFEGELEINGVISGWDTSKVMSMVSMFYLAESFNQPLNWDTSNVEDMESMFDTAKNFNQPLNWDTSNVEYMSSMFYGAESFNQPLNWDTSNVRDMTEMFCYAESFNQPINWDTSKVKHMYDVFRFSGMDGFSF